MASYCDPIRLKDWREPEEESWHTSEQPGAKIRYRLERAVAIVEILTNVDPLETALQERFREQADKWDSETRHLSSPTQRMMHPSYQAILGMGQDVVPFLLRDLQQNRREWFWALSYLTQDNPIDPQDAGKMDKMVMAWVNWGKKKGLL